MGRSGRWLGSIRADTAELPPVSFYLQGKRGVGLIMFGMWCRGETTWAGGMSHVWVRHIERRGRGKHTRVTLGGGTVGRSIAISNSG